MFFYSISALFFLIGMVIYTALGFSEIVSPSSTYYLAWITLGIHVIVVLMCGISYIRVSRLSKKLCVDYGLKVWKINSNIVGKNTMDIDEWPEIIWLPGIIWLSRIHMIVRLSCGCLGLISLSGTHVIVRGADQRKSNQRQIKVSNQQTVFNWCKMYEIYTLIRKTW